ncbi:hypothetical protein FRC02_007185 [Tulasnella sp. 418]|nr:hypothetical protein FRC02_007185 [Tulasnella sp. 418]
MTTYSTQISRLLEILSSYSPPFIYIHDPFGVQPSPSAHIATWADNHQSDTALATVDAIESFSPKLLYTKIINSLSRWSPSWNSTSKAGGDCWNGGEIGKWDLTWDTFVDALRAVFEQLKEKRDKSKTKRKAGGPSQNTGTVPNMILVLNKAERLKDSLSSLIVPISRLRELSMIQVTVVFVSNCAWDDISPPWGSCPDPYMIYIPQLTKQETVQHLSSLFPLQYLESSISPYNPILKPLYPMFLEVLYDSCTTYTLDVKEMEYAALAMWPSFVRPVLEDWRASEETAMDVEIEGASFTLPPDESRLVLIRLFTRSFTEGFNSLYTRSISARDYIKAQESLPAFRISQPFTQLHQPGSEANTPSMKDALALPLGTKLILVAAYVASFNPARSDLRMFGRQADGPQHRKRKTGSRGPRSGSVAKIPQRLLGPSPFALDRFLNVYGALVVEHGGIEEADPGQIEVEVHSAGVLMTISELIQQRLLLL